MIFFWFLLWINRWCCQVLSGTYWSTVNEGALLVTIPSPWMGFGMNMLFLLNLFVLSSFIMSFLIYLLSLFPVSSVFCWIPASFSSPFSFRISFNGALWPKKNKLSYLPFLHCPFTLNFLPFNFFFLFAEFELMAFHSHFPFFLLSELFIWKQREFWKIYISYCCKRQILPVLLCIW